MVYALAQLGIGHIAAYSAAARGHRERTFRTLQDRLPKEFALPHRTHNRGHITRCLLRTRQRALYSLEEP